MKIIKIDNLVINVEELCCFEVSDATTINYIPHQRINFYFTNGSNVCTKYKPQSDVDNIVEKICNIMES